jgi:hypothetical protein
MTTCMISDGLNLAAQTWDRYHYGYSGEDQLISGMSVITILTRYNAEVFTDEETEFIESYINECVCILSGDGEDYAP